MNPTNSDRKATAADRNDADSETGDGTDAPTESRAEMLRARRRGQAKVTELPRKGRDGRAENRDGGQDDNSAEAADRTDEAAADDDDQNAGDQDEGDQDEGDDSSNGDGEQKLDRRTERRLERAALIEQREELKHKQLQQEVAEMQAAAERRNAAREQAEAPQAPAPPEAPDAPAAAPEETPSPALAALVRPVPRARIRMRHVLVLLSFLVIAVAPPVTAAWYLWTRAYDRYTSIAGFSVRTEEIGSAFQLLGGVASLTGSSSSSDSEVLYQFIQSPELVAKVQEKLDLRKIWSKADPAIDPIYAYHAPGTIEDLTAYWQRMVKVYSDQGSGLLDLEVQAFTPEDAQAIAKAIYDESSSMINRLSAIARDDGTRYARQELDQTVEQLKKAREEITRFRNVNQIVDPAASIQSQMGILSSLQSQLAQTLVDLDLLRQSTTENDPRIAQAERRIEAIRDRIADERRKLGIGTGEGASADDSAFADLVGEYERLTVDLEFAQQSYTAARSAYDSAVAEAQHKTRYLAAHVSPTLPESAAYPRRTMLLSLVVIFSLLGWAIIVLIGYSLRDRR